MKTVKRWKFLRAGRKSEQGNLTWKLNKWEKVDGELDMCHNGFHCCKEPYHAFSYVQGELLAQVECWGEHITDDDKECWREQRVLKTYEWTKKDSLRLAIYSAELVLNNFEKEYPNDKRPREAIEAAKKVLFKNTAKNRSAAGSVVSAARSAGSAARSAWIARSAGSAARSAGSAAESAAWSAAWSAESAAWSAESARSAAGSARSAVWSAESAESAAIYNKIIKFFNTIVAEKIK